MKCDIIKDLIPLYIEHMTSEETNNIIEEHISNCDECKKVYEEMSMDISLSNSENKEEKTGKRIKKEFTVKKILILYVLLLLGVITFCIVDFLLELI